MVRKDLRLKKICSSAKRGDTIIEVMFAFAVFSLVAVISIMLMNSGVTQSEAALELVTARNEVNAQAEAIRFVHDAYVDEATLPSECDAANPTADCQQYKKLWENIAARAIPASELKVELPLKDCNEVYQGGNGSILATNKAFVINPRDISARSDITGKTALVEFNSSIFVPAPLNARILYDKGGADTDDQDISSTGANNYNNVHRVEGLWVIAVRGKDGASSIPQYYDFYIQSCWSPPTGGMPTSIDTVIRLYNPSGV